MSSYPRATLGEIVQINPGLPKDMRPANDTLVSFVPMAAVCERAGAIVNSETRLFGEISKGFTLFADRDVLFAKITPCMENGKAAIADDLLNGYGAGSTEFFVLRPTTAVLPEFVYYFIRRPSFRALCKANFSGSAGQQRVPKSYLKKVQLVLPPLNEQRRIVALLDRAAEIRRRAEAARAKARTIIPALFLDTFGDPATNPKRWPIVTVADLQHAELRNGISPSRSGKIPGTVLTLSAITRGAFDASAVKESTFAAPLAEQQSVSRKLFLICRGNGNRELVGQGAYPTSDMPEIAFPDTMIALRTTETEIVPEFLSAVWSSDHVRGQIHSAAKTTNGTFKISQSSIAQFSFPLPPFMLQAAFAEQVQRLEVTARNLNIAVARAEALAAALSWEVFG